MTARRARCLPAELTSRVSVRPSREDSLSSSASPPPRLLMSPPLNSLPLLASLSPPNQVRSDPKAPRTPTLILIAYSVAINVFVLARFLRAQMTLGLFLYPFFRAFAAYMTTLGLSTLFNYFLSVSNVQKILSVFESCHAPAEFSGGGRGDEQPHVHLHA